MAVWCLIAWWAWITTLFQIPSLNQDAIWECESYKICCILLGTHLLTVHALFMPECDSSLLLCLLQLASLICGQWPRMYLKDHLCAVPQVKCHHAQVPCSAETCGKKHCARQQNNYAATISHIGLTSDLHLCHGTLYGVAPFVTWGSWGVWNISKVWGCSCLFPDVVSTFLRVGTICGLLEIMLLWDDVIQSISQKHKHSWVCQL